MPESLGNEDSAKCCCRDGSGVVGRWKRAEVSLKRAVLHPRATKMYESVAQESRATPSGDEEALNCRSSVPRYTLGRRKVWVSLPRSPIHPYVILPCTFRQRKWAEVSPESVVLHSRVTKMLGSVTQACRTAPSGDENARQCCPSVSCCTLGRRKCSEVSPKRAVPHSRVTILG